MTAIEIYKSLVLIPLFRSFIFTGQEMIKHSTVVKVSFNPFIQVFYFYVACTWVDVSYWLSSFNPFIQVFYFYFTL